MGRAPARRQKGTGLKTRHYKWRRRPKGRRYEEAEEARRDFIAHEARNGEEVSLRSK